MTSAALRGKSLQNITLSDFNKKNVVSLIDTSSNSEAAKEELLAMISDSIKYHQLRNASTLERFGKRNIESEDKIKQLDGFRENAKRLIDIAEAQGLNIKIESELRISITTD